MGTIVKERFAVESSDPVVVFIIGMRINKWFSFRKWVPVMLAMPDMIQELKQDPKLGFLHAEYFVNWRGITLIQYWESYEHLESYSRGTKHLAAWKRFNRNVGTDGTVGIYHEAYQVPSGQFEAIYNNMPVFGLAKTAKRVPAIGSKETARRRLGGNNEPVLPSPENPREL